MDTFEKLLYTAIKLEQKLYKAVKVFLIISEIFCAASPGIHRFEPESNQLYNGLHFTWCILVYGCISSSIYEEYTNYNVSLPTVQKPLYFSEYIVYLVNVLIIMVACYYKPYKYRKNIQAVVTIDCKLIAFGIRPCYSAITRFFLIHLLLSLVFTVSMSPIIHFYSGGLAISHLRTMTVYVITNLIIHISNIQYYGLIYAIHLRYKSVISVLRELSKNCRKSNFNRETESQRVINRIRGVVSSLEVFTKEVNSQFAFSLLVGFLGLFLNIVFNVFLIFKYADQKTFVDISTTAFSVVWIVIHIGKVFLILYHNHEIRTERDTIAEILNDIQPHNKSMDISLRRFLLQLMVDTRTHVLCGFLNLDLSLIKSLLENISVLVIFLIQYDVTFEALTKTPTTLPAKLKSQDASS